MTEKTISGVHVHVSPGSAETLARRGGITNHHLIAYFLANISAKNYKNRSMCVEAIGCNISVVFRHSVYMQILLGKLKLMYDTFLLPQKLVKLQPWVYIGTNSIMLLC